MHDTGCWSLTSILFEGGSLVYCYRQNIRPGGLQLLETLLSLDHHFILEMLGLWMHVPPCLVFIDSGDFDLGPHTSMVRALPTEPIFPLMFCGWKPRPVSE